MPREENIVRYSVLIHVLASVSAEQEVVEKVKPVAQWRFIVGRAVLLRKFRECRAVGIAGDLLKKRPTKDRSNSAVRFGVIAGLAISVLRSVLEAHG